MPESTLRHVSVDYMLPVADMPKILTKLVSEPIAAVESNPAEALRIETRIALEGNIFQEEVMNLGDISPNTCPECQVVLIKIREGLITR